MTDDFEMYQGTNVTPYFVVIDAVTNDPIDLSSWTAATWIAATISGGTIVPVIIKHKEDMSVGVDPEGGAVENCVFVPILPDDTNIMADVGQFRHELRITLAEQGQVVVYPLVGSVATFSIIQSLTWNATSNPPAPRLERLGVVEHKSEPEPAPEEPEETLKRVPRLPPRVKQRR